MYQHLENRFRRDLVVTCSPERENNKRTYWIKDPISKEVFEFQEEEYFLCKLINGRLGIQDIVSEFNQKFNVLITERDFDEFIQQISSSNLLEVVEEKELEAVSEIQNQPASSVAQLDQPRGVRQGLKPRSSIDQKSKITEKYIWSLSNPKFFFAVLTPLFKPFDWLFKLATWLIIPSLPLACLIISHHQYTFWQDLKLYVAPIPYLVAFLLNLTLVSLISKVAQGMVITSYGGTVRKFRLVLVLGFFPRFSLNHEDVFKLSRAAQLWSFSTPLLFRLFLFVVGVLTWYSTRTTGTQLSTYALLLAQAGAIDFLLDGNPFWPTDGYLWLIAYFRLPELFERSYLVWDMIFRRRPLPKYLSTRERIGLQIFGGIGAILTIILVGWIILTMANGLAENFVASILGPAANTILFCVITAIAVSQIVSAGLKPRQRTGSNLEQIPLSKTNRGSMQLTESLPRPNTKANGRSKISTKHLVEAMVFTGVSCLMLVPYRSRPGGQVKLLPPKQQDIQVQVEGKVTAVTTKGGNGSFLKAGTVIAVTESVDIENEFSKTQAEISRQEFEIDRRNATLAKLLATPRKEEIEVASQRVAVTQSELDVAIRELQTTVDQAELSAQRVTRYEYLYREGAFSRQQYEDEKRLADRDSNNIETLKSNVQSKELELEQAKANLTLLLSGPYKEEIEAVRSEVRSARAQLQQLQQQLKYLQNQRRSTKLVMPFDGYLTTPSLDNKVGSYLRKGDVFAVAAKGDPRKQEILGEVQIPEVEVDKLSESKDVEIKLFAFQGKSLTGKVVSIQPVAVTDETSGQTNRSEQTGKDVKVVNETAGKVVKVIARIKNPSGTIKPGMSGYAKIDGEVKPVVVVFTRSLMRFIKIEMWSWLP